MEAQGKAVKLDGCSVEAQGKAVKFDGRSATCTWTFPETESNTTLSWFTRNVPPGSINARVSSRPP